MFSRSCTILSFDGQAWQLINIIPSYDSTINPIYDTLKSIPQNILQQNFDSLKRNRVFALPDFYCLNLKGIVYDGIWGFIEIKADAFYRQYNYNNPCSYFEMNKDIPELKNLCNVVDLFKKMIYGNNSTSKKKNKSKT